MKTVVLLLMLICATYPVYARAQDAEVFDFRRGQAFPVSERVERQFGRHSLVIDAGVFFPSKQKIPGIDKIHTGYYTDAKYIFKPNDMFSLATSSGVYGADADSSDSDTKWTTFVIPIKETLLLTVPIYRVEISGGVGFGYYFAYVTEKGSNTIDYDDSTFGYHFTAGAELKLTQRISILAEAVWENAKVELVDGASKVDIGGTAVNGGIRIKF